jgi:PREDICTED: hypothetical protein
MKKLVGFIFMLVLSLTLSMTVYAADDLGSVIAKVAIDKKKDKKKKKKKKKVKKGKKNKKKAKKGKKKVKKSKKDTQPNLKPSEVVEEVLDDYTSNEEEKKDLPVAKLSVKSASKIWTNDVDISTLNLDKALNELLIGKDGYPSAPDEVIAFYSKYHDEGDEPINIETAAGDKSNYLARFITPFGTFKFLSKDSLAYFECSVKPNSNLKGYDINDFLGKLKLVGLDIDMTPKQLESILDYGLKARFKVGDVFWDIDGTGRRVEFKRVTKKFVNFTMSDVFKACAKHRLVFTDNFYGKVIGLVDSDFIKGYIDGSDNYDYKSKVNFEFSKSVDGELGVDRLAYSDNAKYRKTELRISGNINIDTRVEELAKILDEYTGIDLYSFDTSRINNMLKGDAVQEFSVDLERDLGNSKVEISVINNGEKTFQFSVIFTRKY